MLIIVTRKPSKSAKMFRCSNSRNQIDLNSKFQNEKNIKILWLGPLSYLSNTPVFFLSVPTSRGSSTTVIELIGSMTTMDDNLQLFHPIEEKQPTKAQEETSCFFNFQSSFFCLLDQETAVSQTVKHSRKVPMASWGCRTDEHLKTTCGFASLSSWVKRGKTNLLEKI